MIHLPGKTALKDTWPIDYKGGTFRISAYQNIEEGSENNKAENSNNGKDATKLNKPKLEHFNKDQDYPTNHLTLITKIVKYWES